MPLVEVLAIMEINGVSIDRLYLSKLSSEMEKKLQAIDGTTEPHAVKGAIGCGLDIKMVTKAEQAPLMQRIEEEDVLP